MKIENFTEPQQLVCNSGFMSWYYHKDEHEVQRWNSWIADSKYNRELVTEAVCLIAQKSIQNTGITEGQLKEMAKHFVMQIALHQNTVTGSIHEILIFAGDKKYQKANANHIE